MGLSPERFVLREYYSRTNAPEVNCPFYSHFRLYKRREICKLLRSAIGRITAGSRVVRILDLGCGDGSDTDYALCQLTDLWKRPQAADGLEITFAEGVGELVGLVAARISDLSEILPGLRATIVQVNLATALPFDAGAFDIVLCSEVIEHLELPEAFLTEVSRVLCNDGQLILTTDNEPTIFGRAKRLVNKLLGRHMPGDRERFLSQGEKSVAGHITLGNESVPVYGHINARTTVEWERSLADAGFLVVQYGGYDSVVRHLGEYTPWKMVGFTIANAIASSLPSRIGRHLGATTMLHLGKRPPT